MGLQEREQENTRAPRRRGSRSVLLGITVVLALLVATAMCEVVLRLAGYPTWQTNPVIASEPTMLEHDDELGWRNQPGRYEYPAYSTGGPPISVTIDRNGFRATSNSPIGGRSSLLLLGCSFTFGFAVSDNETMAWKLQEKLPDYQVINGGVAGYGTLQTLKALQRYYSKFEAPTLVLYGFILNHQVRNLATSEWLRGLALHARRGHIVVPSVSVGPSGDADTNAATTYPLWPLRERSVLVTLMQERYARLRFGGYDEPRAERTLRYIVAEMARTVAGRGGELGILLLDEPSPALESAKRLFHDLGVRVFDCSQSYAAHLVRGEGQHPDGEIHSRWAQCTAENLAGAFGVQG
jgi:hypothetical protein